MGETKWTREVCGMLETAGAICIPNVMGKMQSHVADRSIVCRYGNFYVEFKADHSRTRRSADIARTC
jgi:hypothetical protein